MRLLDLFCGAGGAAMGYYRAGFTEITGVDIKPQKRYPFDFVQGDALGYLAGLIESGEIAEYDMIHASPPCQAYSVTKHLSNGNHPELVEDTRKLLEASGRPYVIENVPGSPLRNSLFLCGTMFPELKVFRHRMFETNPVLWIPPAPCNHWTKINRNGFCSVFGIGASKEKGGNKAMWQAAMGINWMTLSELSQAIPPAYTEWIGKQLIQAVRA